VRGRRFKTQADIDRYIAQGYGQGEGVTYKPWLRVQDVPSNGRSRKVLGIKTGRQHHLLSDLEFGYLLVLEFSEQVIDIREAFPIFRQNTPERSAYSSAFNIPVFPVQTCST